MRGIRQHQNFPERYLKFGVVSSDFEGSTNPQLLARGLALLRSNLMRTSKPIPTAPRETQS